MSIDQMWLASQAGFFVVGCFIPIAIYSVLRRRFDGQSPKLHFYVAVAIGWLLLNVYQLETFPITYAYVTAHLNPSDERYGMYDGVGENVGALLFGWILPLVSLLVFFLISALFRAIRSRLYVSRDSKRNA